MRNLHPKISFACLLFLLLNACQPDDATVPVAPPDEAAASRQLLTDWTREFLRAKCYAGGMRPNASARAIAYVYLAAYESAVPTLPGYSSTASFLPGVDLPVGLELDFDQPLALHACLTEVTDHFLLNLPAERRSALRDFATRRRAILTAHLSGVEITTAEDWGQNVARRIIAYSQTDTEAEAQILDPQPRAYVPPVGFGYWTYSADPERALYPFWERVRTFAVPVQETSTVAPLPYSEQPGTAYYAEMEEVYLLNNAARAAAGEQLWIAEFWSDDVEGIMMSPPARQISIANQLIEQYDLGYGEALELLLKTGWALNDAAAAWKYKYQHMVMRPSVYVKKHIAPDYTTNLYRFIDWPDPSFPGYPSGHSTFAAAAGGVFIDFFGSYTTFTDRTHEGREAFRGQPRTFNSFEQMIDENAFSRLPLGVHMRMDCAEGVRLGYEIAAGVNRINLR